MGMDSLDRQKLQKNYMGLVRNLNPEDVTDYLFQEAVLSEEDCENIHASPARAQRMRTLLKILPNKSKDGLTKLIVAMKEAGYTELAQIIEAPVTPDDISLEEHSCLRFSDKPDAHDPKLNSLKEQLEQQAEVVSSMQTEIEMLQEELTEHESSEKYKHTITLLNELKKEKVEKQKVYDEMYQQFLQHVNKTELENRMNESLTDLAEGPKASISTLTRANTLRKEATIKCVLLGDGATGKTWISLRFMHKRFTEGYVPTVYENYKVKVKHKNTLVTVNLWDTAGQEDYDRLRPLVYSDSDVALLVFKLNSPYSLENILSKWHPEFRHFCAKVPIILVGNQTDTANDPETLAALRRKRLRFVHSREANKAAEKINATTGKAFLCSALTGEGIQELLDCLVETGLRNRENQRKMNPLCCCCM